MDFAEKKDKNKYYLEWERCQTAIETFDKMILDIRRYGFTLITVLYTTNGYLFGSKTISKGPALAICIVILLLIVTLFRIDRTHEIFLRGAVLRAMRLEEKLQYGLTRCISHWSESTKTATWGTKVYCCFCLAVWILSLAAIVSYDRPSSENHLPTTESTFVSQLTQTLIPALEQSSARVVIINFDSKLFASNEMTSSQSGPSMIDQAVSVFTTLTHDLVFWFSVIIVGAAIVYLLKYHAKTGMDITKAEATVTNMSDNDPFKAHIDNINDLWQHDK